MIGKFDCLQSRRRSTWFLGFCLDFGIPDIYHCLPQQARLEAGVLYEYALWAKRPRATKVVGFGRWLLYGAGPMAELHWSDERLCWLVAWL